MKGSGFTFLLIFTLILSFAACAKRGTPDGGPIDTTPPKYVKARPENFSTNFDAREIRIFFNEYVKLSDPQRQIIISPPMDPRPEITPLGTASRSIRIRMNDTLEPNTTYTINFGRSITDNNEGNPLSFFTYAFSTGTYIDSLSLSGSVSDALLKNPDPFISVMLYEVDSTYTDSVVYNNVPRYVTNTLDSATTFQLNNLKAGTYQLVALRDANNNYTFEPSSDKIAFADEHITIPYDGEVNLNLFKEVLPGRFERPSQKTQQHLIFPFRGRILEDSMAIVPRDVPSEFATRITKDAKTDTLHYWYKPNLERDTLSFIANTPTAIDTLTVRLQQKKRDTLQFTLEPAGNLGINQKINILPSVPLDGVEESLITIVDKDTLPITFEGKYDRWKNEYAISFEKTEKQVYRLTVLPGAFTDFFGTENDTLSAQYRTPTLSDLGNLIVTLQGVESFPVIVQLTTEKGEMAAEKYSSGESTLNFTQMKPGKYLLRLIYDRNENGQWDTGSFLSKRQPERVYYFPDVIEVRANWDISQTFSVE